MREIEDNPDRSREVVVQDSIGMMLLTERALVTCWSTAIGFFARGWFPSPGSIDFVEWSTFRAHLSCFPLLEQVI